MVQVERQTNELLRKQKSKTTVENVQYIPLAFAARQVIDCL